MKMKKLLLGVLLACGILLVPQAHAQQYVQSTVLNLSSTSGALGSMNQGSNVTTHVYNWTVATPTGTVSACTFQLQTSTDGVSFSNAGAVQTCTSSGSYALTGTTAAYIRTNIASITATLTATVTLNYYGYTNTSGVSDNAFFVSESSCSGATTGTVGTGNATDILPGSGGSRVFRLSATAASGSTNTFTCVFGIPYRLTAGKQIIINDIVFLVSSQTTQPTSITLPTVKTFTPPAAVDPETANSATFVGAGGVITIAPTSAQFAAYTAVAAGQFFSLRIIPTTPIVVSSDYTTFQVVIPFVQSASAISIQETPGLWVHYTAFPQ